VTKVLLAGTFGPGRLEQSYHSAFLDIGCEVYTMDIAATIDKYCRFGKIGRYLNAFLSVEPWIRKANRDLVIATKRFRPDLLVVFGQSYVRAGALAQIGACTKTKTSLIWPDTLVNLADETIAALPLYDFVASYGRETLVPFLRLGARRVEWVPLAGDHHLHLIDELSEADRHEYGADISFVGGWRPEREAALEKVLARFPDKKVKVWGPEWDRRCHENESLVKVWQGGPLYGKDFAKVLAASCVSLNIIDDTNYPAANMRFFEIPMAGGVQVCSSCPEMEDEFKHAQTIFYYHSLDEMVDILRLVLSNDSARHKVADRAHRLVMSRHTYSHRAQKIIEQMNL